RMANGSRCSVSASASTRRRSARRCSNGPCGRRRAHHGGSHSAATGLDPHRNVMGASSPFRHWLLTVNAAFGVFLAGALAAPIAAAVGWQSGADALYAAYHFACHQWAFRSFFLFGAQPVAIFDQRQLADMGLDPFTLVGDPSLGWKMAFCERDLAIY